MASIGKMGIIVGLNTKAFNRNIRRVKKSLSGFAKSIGRVAVRVTALGTALGAAGLGAVVGIGIKLAAEFEQANVSFKTMLGSAEDAKRVLADIEKFAAATPFQFPELVSTGKKLLAFETTAEELIPTMRMLGDISAGIGAPIGEIAEIFGKARVQGRLFMEDINQLSGRGINVVAQLAKQFNVEQTAIRELVSKGVVGFGNIEQAFMDMTSEGGKFFGLMEAQSKTTAGLWSTLKDNFGLVARAIGDELLPELNDLMSGMIGMMPAIKKITVELVSNVGQWIKKFIEANTTGGSMFAQFVDGFGNVAIMVATLTDKVKYLVSIFIVLGGTLNVVFGAHLLVFGALVMAVGKLAKGLIFLNKLMGIDFPQGVKNQAEAIDLFGKNLWEEGSRKVQAGEKAIKTGGQSIMDAAAGTLQKQTEDMVSGLKAAMAEQTVNLAAAAGEDAKRKTESVLKGTKGMDLASLVDGKKKARGHGFRQVVASRISAGLNTNERIPVKADPNELNLLTQIVNAIKNQKAVAA